DMLQLDSETGGSTDITGVEMNRTLLAGATALSQLHLTEFLARPNIHLVNREARAFLESDHGQYDVILLPWAATPVANYAGSVGMSNQFLFTREALDALSHRLAPGGMVIVMSGNKINLLASWRDMLARQGSRNIGGSAVVLTDPRQDAAW